MATNSMKFESDNENNERLCLSESKGLSLSDITQATIGNLHEWADNSDQKLEPDETASHSWEDVSDSENTDYLLESDDSNKTEKSQPPPTYQEHIKRQLDDNEEDVRSKRQRTEIPTIHQIPAAINTFYQTNREMCNNQNIATSSLLKNILSIESNLESNLGNDRNADKVGSAKGSPNVTSKASNILPLKALFPGPKSLAARSTNSPMHQQHTAAMPSTDSPLQGHHISTTVSKNSPLPTHHSSNMPESNSPIHGFYSSAMMASNFPFREGQGQFFNKTQQQQQQQTVVSSSHNSNLNSIQQSYLPWANSPMVLNQTKTEKTVQQSYVSPIVHQGLHHVQPANQAHGLQNGIQNGIQFQQSFVTHQTQTIQPQLFQPYILQALNEPISQSSHLQQVYGMPVFHQPPLYAQPHQVIADRKPNFQVSSLMQNVVPIESPKPSFPSPNPVQNMTSVSTKPNFQPNHAMQSMAIQSSTMYGERTSDAQTSTHLMPKLIKTVSETSQTDAPFNLKNLQAAIGCDDTSDNSTFNYGMKEEPKTPNAGKHSNIGSSMYDSPGMDSRFTESLYNLLGSPPPDSPRSKNPILGDLQAVLNRECKKEIVPQSLFGMQTYNNENEMKKKLNVFDRERLIQEKFTALKEKNAEEVRQLSSMFRYQSALIETDRFRTLHESQYPGSYKDSVNQHFDDQLHQVMERVERSIELLDKSNKENYRSRDRQSRPHLSKESVRLMETWYEQNLTHPYPTTHVIEMLAQAGNIGVEQVKKWFANKRNRSSNTRTRTEIAMQKRRLNLMKQQTAEQF